MLETSDGAILMAVYYWARSACLGLIEGVGKKDCFMSTWHRSRLSLCLTLLPHPEFWTTFDKASEAVGRMHTDEAVKVYQSLLNRLSLASSNEGIRQAEEKGK